VPLALSPGPPMYDQISEPVFSTPSRHRARRQTARREEKSFRAGGRRARTMGIWLCMLVARLCESYKRPPGIATSFGFGWSWKASLRILVSRAWRSGTHLA
jgi:hypothetical protein